MNNMKDVERLKELVRRIVLENSERLDNLLLSEQDEIDDLASSMEEILIGAENRKLPERDDNGVRDSDFIGDV